MRLPALLSLRIGSTTLACLAIVSSSSAEAPWTPSIVSRMVHEVARTNTDTTSAVFATGPIALIGDDLVISCRPSGSNCGIGDVFVYRWVGPPENPHGWTRVQELRSLVPPDAPGGLYGFGASLAARSSATGDWIFVGAPCVDPSGPNGAVFAFKREPDGTWALAQSLYAPPLSGNAFGTALAFDGARLIVGQTGRDEVTTDLVQGGADIYRLEGDALIGPSSIWMPFTPGIFGPFAASVAISGDVAVLAGPTVGSFGAANVGMLATFARNADDTWSFEGLLQSPQAKPNGKFGTSIAMSGNVLAVVAPNESLPTPSGAMSGGVVTLFDRGASAWNLRATIADLPAQPNSGDVNQVAFDGAFLVTGRPGYADDIYSGVASLYRVDATVGAAPELVGRAGRSSEFGAYYSGSGERIAVGGGRFAFTRTNSWDVIVHRVVRALPIAAAASDCDGDGEFDGLGVLAGTLPDCDDNVVPDACERDCDGDGVADVCAAAPTMASSAPTAPGGLAWTVGGIAERLFVTRIAVPAGSDGMVRGVLADWLSPKGPHGAIVALYADPNQDGDPSDAALIGAWGVEVTLAPGNERIDLPPTFVGAPGSTFFVGLAIQQPAGLWFDGPAIRAAANGRQPEASWTAWYPFGAFDPSTPFPNGAELLADDWPWWPNILCAALFASPIDANANGIPDACECPADLDGNGAVDANDLGALLGAWGATGGADLDGDGVVGATDLGALLGAWGPCG